MTPRVRFAAPLIALAGAVVLLALLLAATGYAPVPALTALWRGAFGSWDAVFSATLVRATPLILAGLGTAIAFRAGVFNIGAEGQLLAGAVVAAALVLALPLPRALLVPMGLAGGMIGGMAWTALPAFLKRRYGVLEVISTLMLNAVALQMVGWLVRGPLQEPSRIYPQTAPVPAAARLATLAGDTRLHSGFIIAVALTVIGWWVMSHTRIGFQLRATGASASAAASAGGIDVARVGTVAFFVSGALAGLAGAVEVQGVTFAMYENLSPGYGYTAIAVALLARLDARAIVLSAVIFAALEAGATAMQRDAGVPSVMVKVIEALLILVVLATDSWQRRAAVARAAA